MGSPLDQKAIEKYRNRAGLYQGRQSLMVNYRGACISQNADVFQFIHNPVNIYQASSAFLILIYSVPAIEFLLNGYLLKMNNFSFFLTMVRTNLGSNNTVVQEFFVLRHIFYQDRVQI